MNFLDTSSNVVWLCLLCYVYLKIPAGKHLMDLVAVDWFKDTKRMDHVARRQGCAAQVLAPIFSTAPLFIFICFFLLSTFLSPLSLSLLH